MPLKTIYFCIAIAYAPPQVQLHPDLKEAVEMIHCGRSGDEATCQRNGRRAITRLMSRWRQWGHDTDIGDYDVICDRVYSEPAQPHPEPSSRPNYETDVRAVTIACEDISAHSDWIDNDDEMYTICADMLRMLREREARRRQ